MTTADDIVRDPETAALPASMFGASVEERQAFRAAVIAAFELNAVAGWAYLTRLSVDALAVVYRAVAGVTVGRDMFKPDRMTPELKKQVDVFVALSRRLGNALNAAPDGPLVALLNEP